MLGWVLNLVYVLLIAAVSPLLIWRSVRQGKYRQGWSEKLWGRLPERTCGSGSQYRRPLIWLHAVSVGEVLQLRTIVARLKQQRPDCDLLITTTTSTGHGVAKEQFPDCTVAYFPLDFTWAVRAAVKRVQPALVVLVELELWPNFIRQAHQSGVSIVLINGRMSQSSFRGYCRIRPLMRSLLGRFEHLAVQTEEYASRLIELGASPDRVTVTGSVKFDGVNTNRHTAESDALRCALGISPDERVFIAGSTHEPEEQVALRTYSVLRREFADLRLVLVPRHAERFDEVAKLVLDHGFPLTRRSTSIDSFQSGPMHDQPDALVALLDTLGELSTCWALADVAFVGGSLTSRGGQNMIEPAGYGAAVIVGPNTHNFRDVVEGLQFHDGICVIPQAGDLTPTVRERLQNPAEAHRQGVAAQAFVMSQQGATERTMDLLIRLLPSPIQTPQRRAA